LFWRTLTVEEATSDELVFVESLVTRLRVWF